MRRLMILAVLAGLLVAGILVRPVTNVSAVGHTTAAAAKKVCKTKKVHGKKKKVCQTVKSKPKPTPTPTLSLAQQVDKTLTTDHFSGSILLEKGGQILLEKGYGIADRASTTPDTAQTKFPVPGVNLSMAAVGIMKLQEEGKLLVHDKLCSFISDCPAAWQPITLDELLSETSGIADYSYWISSTGGTDMTLTACEHQPLVATPGSGYAGSDCNSFLSNTVIEKVSGESWSDFMQQIIFGPAGMTNSGRMTNALLPPQRAQGYTGSTLGQDANYNAYYLAYSTLEDLYRYDTALLSGKIISKQSLEAMMVPGPVREDDTASLGYAFYQGYGFHVLKATSAPPPRWTRPMERQTGSYGRYEALGFGVINWFSPDDRAVLLYLNNDFGTFGESEEYTLIESLIRPALFGK